MFSIFILLNLVGVLPCVVLLNKIRLYGCCTRSLAYTTNAFGLAGNRMVSEIIGGLSH